MVQFCRQYTKYFTSTTTKFFIIHSSFVLTHTSKARRADLIAHDHLSSLRRRAEKRRNILPPLRERQEHRLERRR